MDCTVKLPPWVDSTEDADKLRALLVKYNEALNDVLSTLSETIEQDPFVPTGTYSSGRFVINTYRTVYSSAFRKVTQTQEEAEHE